MLLHTSYLFDPERHELYGWDYILEDFQEYIKVYGEGILGYECDGDELKIWMEKCNDELESIVCQNAAVWTLPYKEKTLSEKTKNNSLAWWGIYGKAAPNLRMVTMDFLGLTTVASECERGWSSYGFVHNKLRNRLAMHRQHKLVYILHNARINGIDNKRHRKTTRLLNTYYTSRVQQTILRRRHGSEYGASGDVRDAWIPDSTIEENKFSAETGRNLDDTRLGFDAREVVLDDEILDDMSTRAEASTADAIDNENELGGDGIFDESREQPLRHLDDLRDEDFEDEDVPPPTDTFDTDFETDDINRNHFHVQPSSGECSNHQPSKIRRTDTTYKTPESELPKNPITSTSEDPPQASSLSIPNTNLSTNPLDDTIHSSPERRRSGRPLSPVNYKEAF
ncbi:hypothetical protein R1sor_026595 [Riccia sorocarpa]|uniref:HAT C-terminal dimerisation domain-containing protein n=1 Tax=Riccia sorocarpa TaxID=122646 RepID=A0ABD3GDI3_9MARC